MEMPDNMKEFFEMMTEMVKRKRDIESSNPAKYPRQVEVVDDEALMLFAELDRQEEIIYKMHNAMKLAYANAELIKTRFFIRCEDAYPGITSHRAEGSGYRRWKGKIYFVSYDRKEPDADKEDGPGGEDLGKELPPHTPDNLL